MKYTVLFRLWAHHGVTLALEPRLFGGFDPRRTIYSEPTLGSAGLLWSLYLAGRRPLGAPGLLNQAQFQARSRITTHRPE